MSIPLLALKLKELRMKHNYTQKYVSYYLNMSRGGYAQYEIGSRTPGNDILLKLSQLYQVGIDTFINTETIPLADTPSDYFNKSTDISNQDTPQNEIVQLSAEQLKHLGLLLLNAAPPITPESMSQEDINFLSMFKCLPVETQEDIKFFCSYKLKQLSKKQK